MQKAITIRSISIEKRLYIERKRQSRLEAKASMKANRKLSASEQDVADKNTAYDIDPVEFARAFKLFRDDMHLLSEAAQIHFKNLLRGYLIGKVDHEIWRQAVSALSELRRAHTLPPPKNYWKRSF